MVYLMPDPGYIYNEWIYISFHIYLIAPMFIREHEIHAVFILQSPGR